MQSSGSDSARWRSAAGYAQSELDGFLMARLGCSREELGALRTYLTNRKAQVYGKEAVGFVYAVTRLCNLSCRHCGVDAPYQEAGVSGRFETSTAEAKRIIDNVHGFIEERALRPFFMFGGGEPTLRDDFPEILRHASEAFGPANVGFCTNGTARDPGYLLSLHPYVGLIETSIDGLEAYHNTWRRTHTRGVENPFRATLRFVDEVLACDSAAQKLEVSSVITRDNLDQLPELAAFLRERGVRNYSVHRTMPVGRMARLRDQIPSPREYLRFMLAAAPLCETSGRFSFHIHHSLESIYSALLLGEDIHRSDLLTGSGRHSIGIAWDGTVHFDPWSMVPPYASLSPGSLLDSGLGQLVDDQQSVTNLVLMAQRSAVRCQRCGMHCTGGMRLNAVSEYIWEATQGAPASATYGNLVAGISRPDPACPLV